FIPQIVGTDDRGVAPGVAAAEPAALQHRDVAHAMLLGEVIRSGQTVAAGADDHHVIRGPWLGRTPLLRPGGSAKRMSHQAEDRKAQRCFPDAASPWRILTRASC